MLCLNSDILEARNIVGLRVRDNNSLEAYIVTDDYVATGVVLLDKVCKRHTRERGRLFGIGSSCLFYCKAYFLSAVLNKKGCCAFASCIRECLDAECLTGFTRSRAYTYPVGIARYCPVAVRRELNLNFLSFLRLIDERILDSE